MKPSRIAAQLVAATLCIGMLGSTGAYAGASVARLDPSSLNFTIAIAKVPPGATANPSKCTNQSADTKRCVSTLVLNATNVALPGILVDKTDKLSGQLTTSCNIQASGQMGATVPINEPANGVFNDPSASMTGSQQCTFTADFGSSSISGTLDGTYSSSYQNGSGTQTTSANVNVVSGTGVFAGDVGSGTYSDTAPYSLHFGSGASSTSSGTSTTAGGSSPGSSSGPSSGSSSSTTTTVPASTTFPAGKVGTLYTLDYSSAAQSISLSSGSLPPGVSIQGAKVTGTPTTAGTYTFSLAISVSGSTHTVSGTVTIGAASTTSTSTPIPPTTTTIPHGTTTTTARVTNAHAGGLISLVRTHASSAGGTGTLRLHLHKGASGLVIVAPGKKLTAASDAGLVIATGIGRTCQATGTSGSHKVALGKAKVVAKNGKLILRSKLRSALTPGSWVISVQCGNITTKKSVTVS